jgi:hypothetical protein
LSELGYFTWSEWAAALGDELKTTSHHEYYENWLSALERLATAKGLTDWAALLDRKEAWAEAYRRTPHGKPIELAAATSHTSKAQRVRRAPPNNLGTGPRRTPFCASSSEDTGGTKWH